MTQAVAAGELMRLDDIKFNEKKARGLIGDIVSKLRLPQSVVVEFENLMLELYKTTLMIGGKLISFGRILLAKLKEFMTKNPNMAIGTIIGALFGLFLSAVPLIGSILFIISTAAGWSIGAFLDRNNAQALDDNTSITLKQEFEAAASPDTKQTFKVMQEISIGIKR